MITKLSLGLLVGAFAGLMGALCGVGGGTIMVPAFLAMGLKQKQAIATSLAVIIITATVATCRNEQEHLVHWKIVAVVALGASIAAWYGSGLMHNLPASTLKKIFGVLLLIVGVRMLIK